MALLSLARETARPLTIFTVDHGLRPEAAHEAAMVARWCGTHGLSHHTLQWQPPKKAGGTLSGEARKARYRLMARACADQAIPTLLVAHHADDQAETVLMRLARGAGVLGLSGMDETRQLIAARGDVALVRPLLGVRKAELVAHCARHDLPVAEDPTNRNLAYDRVRARAVLARTDGLTGALLGAQRALSAQWHEMAGQIDGFVADHGTRHPFGPLAMDRTAYRALSPRMRTALLGHLIRAFNPGRHAPGRDALAALDRFVCAGEGGHTLGGLLWLAAPDGRIWAGREARAVQAPARVAPGAAVLWDRQWRIVAGADPQTIAALGAGEFPETPGEFPENIMENLAQSGIPRPLWAGLGGMHTPAGPAIIGTPGLAGVTPLWPRSSRAAPILAG